MSMDAPQTPEKSPASGQVASGRYRAAKAATLPPAANSGANVRVTLPVMEDDE